MHAGPGFRDPWRLTINFTDVVTRDVTPSIELCNKVFMFDWWDTRISIAITGSLLAVKFIGAAAWDRYVARHLSVRQHVWCLPLSVIAALATGSVAFFIQQIRLGELLILLLLLAGAMLSLLVGARCPECRCRIQYRPSRHGPVTYRCRHCGYHCTGWPLKDSLPN